MNQLEQRLAKIRRRSEQMKKARIRIRKMWCFTAVPAAGCLVLCAAVILTGLQPTQENGNPAGVPEVGQEPAFRGTEPKQSAAGTDGATPTEDVHNHQAALTTQTVPVPGEYGGSAEFTLYQGQNSYKLEREDAAAMARILYSLSYDPDRVCRCMAPYRAEVEGHSYSIHWEYDFVRCEEGQADLTVEQSKLIRQIIDRAIGQEGSE